MTDVGTCIALAEEPLTPWGESYDDLADVILGDPNAPPFLQLAAFVHKHGAPGELRRLIADAVALNEAEAGRGN